MNGKDYITSLLPSLYTLAKWAVIALVAFVVALLLAAVSHADRPSFLEQSLDKTIIYGKHGTSETRPAPHGQGTGYVYPDEEEEQDHELEDSDQEEEE